MTDEEALRAYNDHFIDACRAGSWERLREILAVDFSYLDGRTGEVWDLDCYAADLRAHPEPTLVIDQVVVHVSGDTAVVSARSSRSDRDARMNRYVDTYALRSGRWVCVHACVWPLPAESANAVIE